MSFSNVRRRRCRCSSLLLSEPKSMLGKRRMFQCRPNNNIIILLLKKRKKRKKNGSEYFLVGIWQWWANEPTGRDERRFCGVLHISSDILFSVFGSTMDSQKLRQRTATAASTSTSKGFHLIVQQRTEIQHFQCHKGENYFSDAAAHTHTCAQIHRHRQTQRHCFTKFTFARKMNFNWKPFFRFANGKCAEIVPFITYYFIVSIQKRNFRKTNANDDELKLSTTCELLLFRWIANFVLQLLMSLVDARRFGLNADAFDGRLNVAMPTRAMQHCRNGGTEMMKRIETWTRNKNRNEMRKRQRHKKVKMRWNARAPTRHTQKEWKRDERNGEGDISHRWQCDLWNVQINAQYN